MCVNKLCIARRAVIRLVPYVYTVRTDLKKKKKKFVYRNIDRVNKRFISQYVLYRLEIHRRCYFITAEVGDRFFHV